MELKISVSIGEIFDKLSILEIKSNKIKDVEKLAHINTEINKINIDKDLMEKNKILYDYLLIINEKIWDLMDQTKNTMNNDDFSNLSFQTYHENAARYRVKALIDKLNTSLISEVKSYRAEKVIFLGYEQLHPKVKEIHETMLRLYFDNVVYTCNNNIEKEINVYVYNFLHPNIQPKFSHLYNTKLIKKIGENYETINYLHSGALGDLIHCLYVVKVKYLLTGKKGNIYLKEGQFTNDLNKTFEDIKKTIENQEYVNILDLYSSQNIDINLDIFRDSIFLFRVDWLINLSMTFKIPLLYIPWMTCDYSFKNPENIIINRSVNKYRHINNFPWDNIVTNNSCVFITYDINHYNEFISKEKVRLLKIDNFSDLVNNIGNCKFFIGNQSAPLAIACSLGIPCLGELIAPNFYTNLPNFSWISEQNKKLDVSQFIKIEKEIQ